MTNARPSPDSICPVCTQNFMCGVVAGASQCWCYELPHSMPIPAPAAALTGATSKAAGCFCPGCLHLRRNVLTTDVNVVTTQP